MNPFSVLGLLGVLAAVAAAQTPRVRDSAGVRIVENGPRLQAPIAFQLGQKPSFDIGGLQQDPADELSDRNGYPRVLRLPGGNIVVLDRTRVLFFDASGKRIKAFGRQGDGPGEFQSASDVCTTRGDTVLVAQGRRPITKLTKSGELVAMVPLPEGTLAEGPFCFNDGTFVIMNRVRSGANEPAVYRFSRASESAAMNVILDREYPLFDMLVRKYSPKVAFQDRMYFMNGDAFEIRAYGRDGKLGEIIRTSDAPAPMTDAEKARLPLGAYRPGSTPAEMEDARRRAIENSKTKTVPTVRGMFIDVSGRIWVEDWQPTEDPTRETTWTAFDSTGRLLGRLQIPGGTREQRRFVVGFGKDEVILHRLDDDGAVHYTAYPIQPVKR
jgi:hypothetical protein